MPPDACTNVFARGRRATVRITCLTYFQHFTHSMTEIPSSYRVHTWCRKTRMAELQSSELWKSLVTWWSTQSFGHNTSTWQTDRQTDSHVAVAIAALMSGSKDLVFGTVKLVFSGLQITYSFILWITSGQNALAKAAPNFSGKFIIYYFIFYPHDRHTTETSIAIVRISCIWCGLKR